MKKNNKIKPPTYNNKAIIHNKIKPNNKIKILDPPGRREEKNTLRRKWIKTMIRRKKNLTRIHAPFLLEI
jgi:hypothetical protein